MVDKDALREAWHDYWQHPEWSSRHVAKQHGIKPSRLHTEFRRAGYIARRTPAVVKACRLDASHCPGYQAVFCAQCPCPPTCEEWACGSCKARYECACTNECLRPRDWQVQLGEYMKEKQRNKRAVRMYRYAWTSPDEPLEVI